MIRDKKLTDENAQQPVYANVAGLKQTPVNRNAVAFDAGQQNAAPGTVPEPTQTSGNEGVGSVQAVTYIDDNGEKQTGYASVAPNTTNTTTEQQPVATQPTTTEPAKADSELDYWGRLAQQYDAIYKEAVAANDAQAAAAADRAKMAAEEQIAALAAQYAGTNRQLYRDYMQTQKALPQQLAAMGYSGGMSESARLRLGMSYEEALAENERARIAGVAGINSTQAQNIYEIEAAAAEANRQALAQQQQNMLQLDAEKRQYEVAAAENMAAAGDFSGYLKLGYTQEEVDYLTRLWLKQNPGAHNTWVKSHPEEAARLGIKLKSTNKSGGGGGGGGGYFSQFDQGQYINAVGSMLEEAKKNGASNREIVNAIDKEYDEGKGAITSAGRQLLIDKLL